MDSMGQNQWRGMGADGEMDEPRWRAFRLFLASLPDVELDVIRGQLDQEMTARRECETNAVRLFFSSLTASDLEAAREEIDAVCGKTRSAGSGSLGVRLSSNRHFSLAFRAKGSDESSCANHPRQGTTMKNTDTTAGELAAGQGALVARETSKKAAGPKAQRTAKKAKREANANKKEPRPKATAAVSKGAQILEMIG